MRSSRQAANRGTDVIRTSRRENLPWWGRLLLHYLPSRVYRQVLREHTLAMAALPLDPRMEAMGMERLAGWSPPTYQEADRA